MIFPAGCSCYGGRQHVFELATGQLLMKSCRKNRHDVMWSPHRKVFYADPRSNITTNSTISLYFLGNKLFFFCPDVKSKSPFQGAICPLTCPQQYPLSSNAFLKMTIPSKVWMYRASASLKFLRNCFSNMPQKRSYLDIFLNPQQMHFCTFRWLDLECYTESWRTLISKTNLIC